jgi:hypothetical protein
MSYTNKFEVSSTTANIFLDAERSKHLTAFIYFVKGIGNGLSINIFNTEPFFNPTKIPSFSGGPLIILMYRIKDDKCHSLSKMPANEISCKVFS